MRVNFWIRSSHRGVTIAMKSSELATDLLIKHFNGETADWQRDYADVLMKGVDTFRAYVEGWYTGELQDVIFYENPEPKIKQMICSILAGYAWGYHQPVCSPTTAPLAYDCRDLPRGLAVFFSYTYFGEHRPRWYPSCPSFSVVPEK